MKEAEQALNRVMNLDQFIVTFELPEDFCFHGPIPFDLKISEGMGQALVVALTQEEAEDKVQMYFDEAANFWEESWEVDLEDDEEDDEDDDVEDAN
jgi:hypothetical protein